MLIKRNKKRIAQTVKPAKPAGMSKAMKDLCIKFTKACELENKNQAMKLLDKIQKNTDKSHDIYLFTCRARVDICTSKFKRASSNIDILMHELFANN